MKDGFLQLNVVGNKVVADKDVSQYSVTPASFLVVWVAKRTINEPFAWIATAGPEGPCGKDATDFSYWFPKLTVSWWRKEETCSYYFDDAKEDGIIFDKQKGKATHLRNRSANCFHAKALRPVGKREKSKDGSGYALEFNKSLYFVDQVAVAQLVDTFACLFISFKVSEFPKDRQYLMTTPKLHHALSIEGNKVQVWSDSDEPTELEYLSDKYNIVFVQWVFGGTGYFSVNWDLHTTFKTSTLQDFKLGMYLGAKPDKEYKSMFSGKIICIDFYDSAHEWSDSTPRMLPDRIKKEVMVNHQNRFM